MKKGFTLIELLAVIIILGVLSVIIVPKIQKSIKDSKKSTYEASAYALDREADIFYTNTKANLEQFNGCEYNFTANNNTCNGFEFNGQKPDAGTLKISDKGATSFALQFDEYCYIKDSDSDEITVQQYNSQTCKTGGVRLVNDADGSGGITSGDEVKLGAEHFYILNVGNSKVTMLAKYNLNIGYEWQCDYNYHCTMINEVSSSTLGYGTQDANSKGWSQEGRLNYKGTIAFLESALETRIYYWIESDTLKSAYGNSYPAYVYDSNSDPYNYVENYIDYLKEQGAPSSIAGRLPSLDDLSPFGCEYDTSEEFGTPCQNTTPPWIYSSSYWLGDAYHDEYDEYIFSLGFDQPEDEWVPGLWQTNSYLNDIAGVRPVVVINKSDIQEIQQNTSEIQEEPGNR